MVKKTTMPDHSHQQTKLIAETGGNYNDIKIFKSPSSGRIIARKTQRPNVEVYDPRQKEELFWLRHLAKYEHRFDTLRTPTNPTPSLLPYESTKALDYDFLPGVPIAAIVPDSEAIPDLLAESIAHACADYYIATRSDLAIDPRITTPVALHQDLFESALSAERIADRHPHLKSFLNHVGVTVPQEGIFNHLDRSLNADPLPPGVYREMQRLLCHRDITRANVLKMADGKIGIIDWEGAYVGAGLMDFWRQIRLLGLGEEQAKRHIDIFQERGVFIPPQRLTVDHYIKKYEKLDLLAGLLPDLARSPVWAAHDESRLDPLATQLTKEVMQYVRIQRSRPTDKQVSTKVKEWLEIATNDFRRREQKNELTPAERAIARVDPDRTNINDSLPPLGAVWSMSQHQTGARNGLILPEPQ
jgi:hypothetical protein